ncbi:MAG: AI-2E family transporter, partial [Planctomycetota bacterium]|nr:AI-2E family transporter [Planctomycetota bacterium]
ALLVLWFALSIRSVINPLLLGYLLAFILHPMVAKLQQRGFSERMSVNLIFVSGFLLLGLTGFGLVVQTKNLVRDVITDPEVRDEITTRFEDLRERLEERLGEDFVPSKESLPSLEKAWDWVRGFAEEHREAAGAVAEKSIAAAGGIFGAVKSFLGAVVAIGGLFLLVPLYTYYLLFELGRVHAWFRKYLPRGEKDRIVRVSAQVGEVLASFFRGRLLVCLLKGGLISIGLWIAQVPYAFLFGMTSGFLSVIPFIGPFLGFLCAFVVGVLEHGIVGSLIRNGIVFGVAELVEGYGLIPYVLGDSLGLHPIVVLFALLAGGAALGMFGVLISLPLAAVIVILFKEFVTPALQALAEEGGERGPPG